MTWPPGPYFKAVALRWSPYLAGVALALLKWDSSAALEDQREEAAKQAVGMPIHERIADRVSSKLMPSAVDPQKLAH